MSKPLNEKQQKVLKYVQDCAQNGLPPSVREICNATGIKSTSTVHGYLSLLEREGYINRESGLNRAIRMPGENVARIPLLGKVTAGMPILAVQITSRTRAVTIRQVRCSLCACPVLR